MGYGMRKSSGADPGVGDAWGDAPEDGCGIRHGMILYLILSHVW